MSLGLPKLPKINLPTNPLESLRGVVRSGREQVEKAGSEIRALGNEIRGFSLIEQQTHSTAPERQKEAPSDRTATSSTSASKLTNEETIAYQNREIGTELWLLEKHLAQGCRIPNRAGKPIPCDCCEKGSFIAGLAYEAIPIAERAGQPSAIYEKIATWAKELEPMVTVPAVESGQYDYKNLAGQASALRKELMGTRSLSALRQTSVPEKFEAELGGHFREFPEAERSPAVIPTEPYHPQAENYYLGGWKPGDIALYTDFGLRSLYVVQVMEWPEKLGERFAELIEGPFYLPVMHDRSMGSVRAKVIDTTLAEWDFTWRDSPLPDWHHVGTIHYYHYTNLYRNIFELINKEKRVLRPDILSRTVGDLMDDPGWEVLKGYGLVKEKVTEDGHLPQTEPVRRLRYFIIRRDTGKAASLLYQTGNTWELFSFKTKDYQPLGKLTIKQIAPALEKLGISGEDYHITSEPPLSSPYTEPLRGAEENLTPRAIREGRHPYQPPEGIPAKVYPVRASTGEGYSLFDTTEGVWFGRRSTTYQEVVERADKENRRLWEAHKALHPQTTEPHSTGPPAGTCYEDAWRYLLKEEEGHLIHGSVETDGKRINHAWAETVTGYIWEPETKKFFTKEGFKKTAKPQEHHRYTVEQASIMAARTKNLGPWTEEERSKFLKEKSPAVIPIKPRPRRESDLEYLADSPEYLAQTIEATGYRDKLANTFQEAIARAKGLR